MSANHIAVQLCEKSGFRIIVTIPEGIINQHLGYADAYMNFSEID